MTHSEHAEWENADSMSCRKFSRRRGLKYTVGMISHWTQVSRGKRTEQIHRRPIRDSRHASGQSQGRKNKTRQEVMHHEIQQETLSKPKTRQLKSVLCSEEALIKATDWSSNQMTCLNTTLWVLNDVWLHTPPSYWPAVGPHHVIPSALVIDRAALPFLLLQPRTGGFQVSVRTPLTEQRLNHIHIVISFVLLISYSAPVPCRIRKSSVDWNCFILELRGRREIMILFKMNIAKLDLTLHFSGPLLSVPSENKGSGPTACFILISCTPHRDGICVVTEFGLLG